MQIYTKDLAPSTAITAASTDTDTHVTAAIGVPMAVLMTAAVSLSTAAVSLPNEALSTAVDANRDRASDLSSELKRLFQVKKALNLEKSKPFLLLL